MAVGPSELPGMPQVKGLRLSTIEAGIRYQNRKDLVILELATGSSVAGVFTQNAFCAAPVHIAKKHLQSRRPDQKSFFLINTGNANAGTGKQGFEDANACCEALAELTGVDASQVLPFSTGVIGEKLPSQVIVKALPRALESLNPEAWVDAATGIMTTDTRPKAATRMVRYGGKDIVISGISKGAGMIKPNMATMLCFIATDANVPQELLQNLSSELSEKSFNRITIDGDTTILASIAPYSVVNSATAIAGPMDFGSSMFDNIATRPISVPIIPIAGATSPNASQTFAPCLCRSTAMFLSFINTVRTTSAS
jgi:glutamate N-acetyltransferase/amino-acid N-acetyltransferase